MAVFGAPTCCLLALTQRKAWVAIESIEVFRFDGFETVQVQAEEQVQHMLELGRFEQWRDEAAAPVIGAKRGWVAVRPNFHPPVRDHGKLHVARFERLELPAQLLWAAVPV